MKSAINKKQLKDLIQNLLSEDEEVDSANFPVHTLAVEPWKRAMASGTLTGKVFSHHTVTNYARYAVEYLKKHPELTLERFRHELEGMPPEMFGRRDKYFKAILCFAKFLVREKSLPRSFIEQAMEIQPRRHLPAKQHLNRVSARSAAQGQYHAIAKAHYSLTSIHRASRI
jgi:hypothetical protein